MTRPDTCDDGWFGPVGGMTACHGGFDFPVVFVRSKCLDYSPSCLFSADSAYPHCPIIKTVTNGSRRILGLNPDYAPRACRDPARHWKASIARGCHTRSRGTGSRPRIELARQAGLELVNSVGGVAVNPYMQTSDPHIYAVGDATATATLDRIAQSMSPLLLAGPANRQGRLAADHIFGQRSIYKGHVGTRICKLFDLTIGGVGISVNSLRALGRDHQYVTVRPLHHSGYYPGAENITVRLAFENMAGKFLDAQLVGKAGVDKRVDVLATAMQADMTVFGLEELELGYSPPYSAAKYLVNMAGFVAANVIHGDVDILHAEEIEREIIDGSVLLDARSRKEIEACHVQNAVNIPTDELRARLGELNPSQRTVVYCQVGYRGYLAHRILKQHGVNSVINLDGGLKEVMEG